MTDATEELSNLLKDQLEQKGFTCRYGSGDEPDLCLTVNAQRIWIDCSAFFLGPGKSENDRQDTAESVTLSLQRKHRAHYATYTPYIVALKGWDVELPDSSSSERTHLDLEDMICVSKSSGEKHSLLCSPKTGGHPDLELSLAGPGWPGLAGIIYVTDQDIPQSTGQSIILRYFTYLCNASSDNSDFFGFKRLMTVYARNQDGTWISHKTA